MTRLKLATTMTNPGEPAATSRYDDPAVLRARGFNGLVVYESAALSGGVGVARQSDPDVARFVRETEAQIDAAVERAAATGPDDPSTPEAQPLDVYLAFDLLVLDADAVARDADAVCCRNRPGDLCPGRDAVWSQVMAGLDAMLDRWPSAAGVVLRIGDNDATRLPHLMGNDIYRPHCPQCEHLGPADRVVRAVTEAWERVVAARGKRLILRAWNLKPGGLHDDAELAAEVARRLPGAPDDDRLVLSFKVGPGDFWRYQPWNTSSLVFGRRPVLYELQCQREFEGKGAVPDFQAGLWGAGMPESAHRVYRAPEAFDAVAGLADAASRVNFAGVLAWVRGGGWGGPFVGDEWWIDANVYAAGRLGDDPAADPAALAAGWVDDALPGLPPARAAGVVQALQTSAEMVRKAFYIEAFARRRGPWHPNAGWIQDDLLDVEAAGRIIRGLPEADLDAVVHEKQEAVDRAVAIHRALTGVDARSGVVGPPLAGVTGDRLARLANTALYAASLFETLRDLLAGMVAVRRYQRSPTKAGASEARVKLRSAQTHWNHHVQRSARLPGTASPFRESRFWELTQEMLDAVEAK